jgi:hypothetical protein
MNNIDDVNAAFIMMLNDEDFEEYIEDLTDDERDYCIRILRDLCHKKNDLLNLLKGEK